MLLGETDDVERLVVLGQSLDVHATILNYGRQDNFSGLCPLANLKNLGFLLRAWSKVFKCEGEYCFLNISPYTETFDIFRTE